MEHVLAINIDPDRLEIAVVEAAYECELEGNRLIYAETVFASADGHAYILAVEVPEDMAEGYELDPDDPSMWTWVFLGDDGLYVLEANI